MNHTKQKSRRLRRQDFCFGGGCRIRTRVGLRPNGFQDRPVMTASVTLRIAPQSLAALRGPLFFCYAPGAARLPLPSRTPDSRRGTEVPSGFARFAPQSLAALRGPLFFCYAPGTARLPLPSRTPDSRRGTEVPSGFARFAPQRLAALREF